MGGASLVKGGRAVRKAPKEASLVATQPAFDRGTSTFSRRHADPSAFGCFRRTTHGGHVRLHGMSFASHLLRRVARSKDRTHPLGVLQITTNAARLEAGSGLNLPVLG